VKLMDDVERGRKAVVLDASAFLAGLDPFSIEGDVFTVPGVKNEVSRSSLIYLRLRTAEESGKLKIKEPGQEALGEAKAIAAFMGDAISLSDVDVELIALAIELVKEGREVVLITDDYSIQNVVKKLGIPFSPVATFGIKEELRWVVYCPACHRRFSSDIGSRTCPVCGTPLKRRPLKRRGS